MAPHSSTLAWKIPWTEEPRLQSIGSLRVVHDWATSLSLFTFMHWRRKRQPTPVFLPGESQGHGAWWAAIYGSHRVGHDWSDLAAAAAEAQCGRGWAFRLQEGPAFLSFPLGALPGLHGEYQRRIPLYFQHAWQSRFNSHSLAREAERKYYLGGLLLDHTVSSPLGSASVYLPVRFCCCRCGCSTYKTVWDA